MCFNFPTIIVNVFSISSLVSITYFIFIIMINVVVDGIINVQSFDFIEDQHTNICILVSKIKAIRTRRKLRNSSGAYVAHMVKLRRHR